MINIHDSKILLFVYQAAVIEIPFWSDLKLI